ncbi:MAG: tetratricopeptide repeat protein, partial [Gammaproteobacteria bacterium]|nr:tetratricopeptide repeat protein [Gammaproteobacteria bacterium]
MFITIPLPHTTTWRLPLVVLLVVALSMLASAQTTSELLEKAVYTEETVGNLDEAIDLYGKVIASAKAASREGAEAQYRLALCLKKQGKEIEAEEAFRTVVDEYPKVAEFVALAKELLPGALELLPTPWQDGQILHLTMKLASGMEIGKEVCSIHATELQGKPVWRCSNRVYATINGANSFSEAFCDKETFAPQQSYWTHSLLGKADATYADAKASINILGREDPVEFDFSDPIYNQEQVWDNEQGIQLFRLLPLEIGFSAKLPIVATLTGNFIPLELEVPEKETITTPAGTFDCFKMVLNIGQTFWISDDADRYLVQFEAGGVTA